MGYRNREPWGRVPSRESGFGRTGFGRQVLAFELQLSTLRPLFRVRVGGGSRELVKGDVAAGIAPPCRNGLNAADHSRVLSFVKPEFESWQPPVESNHWIRGPFDADTGGTKWCWAGRRGTVRCRAVQIADLIERSSRLCRPALRKASGFPASAGASVLLRAGWKAEPSSRRGGGFSGHTPYGKAKPFRTSGGAAAGRRRPDRG